jgi:hypothetical protein
MKTQQPITISIDELETMTKRSGKNREAAIKALSLAKHLQERGAFGSILLDRHLRTIKVFGLDEK